MDNALADLFPSHLAELKTRWRQALRDSGHGAAVVWAGSSQNYLFDDQAPPFRANPHLLQWFPYADCEHSALIVQQDAAPVLHFYEPADYWHAPPALPVWADAYFEVHRHSDLDELHGAIDSAVAGRNDLTAIGANDYADKLANASLNERGLLHDLDFRRAVKTPFELECMRRANRAAVAGHKAAAAGFDAALSEFDIQLAYLAAARQGPEQLPYGNIVALNAHAGILHYQHQQPQAPTPYLSLLIDAGASYLGYAADVTRTYAAQPGAFADLIARLDDAQQTLLGEIEPGQSYADLHQRMHQLIGAVLHDAGLVRCSGDDAVAAGITRAFFPHGLGHLLGLQTHDVAGHQIDRDGTERAPGATDPALRLTRDIEPDQVFTIEPGIYFIPMLLDALRASASGREIVWAQVEPLLDYGGIRIEDNVRVLDEGIENFTRDAFRA